MTTISKESITVSGAGFTVRHAHSDEFARARELILKVTLEDIKFPYTPRYHFDIDQPEIEYMQNPRQALYVAVDDSTCEIIGTTGVRTGGPVSPPHPAWLAGRYRWDETAQLYRVYIAREHRRRGVASALVEAARRFVVAEGGYSVIYLHTDASVEGAEPFWRSVARLTVDGRALTDSASDAVHFELPMHVPLRPFRSEISIEQEPDWRDWYRRWEVQQSSYIPCHEERFERMLNVLAAAMPEEFTLIDFMCGPGAIAQRVVERFPRARVIAIDLDPVLLEMGRNVVGDAEGRIRWGEADLGQAGWQERLGIEQVDAVLSTTAIHYLHAGQIVDVYRGLAEIVRPGGIVLNGDQMYYAQALPVIRQMAIDYREAHIARARAAGAESWQEWWLALRREPALRDLFVERDRRFEWRNAEIERAAGATTNSEAPPMRHTHFEVHRAGLLDAGFREVDVVWQDMGNRLLMAVR